MPDARTRLEHLGHLGKRMSSLEERVAVSANADSATARNLGVLADRIARQTDRSIAGEYADFQRDRAREAADERQRTRRDIEACRRH